MLNRQDVQRGLADKGPRPRETALLYLGGVGGGGGGGGGARRNGGTTHEIQNRSSTTPGNRGNGAVLQIIKLRERKVDGSPS